MMLVPQLNRRLLPFFIGVPLAWGVVLIFHPAPDPDHIHGSLQDQVTQWLVVHCLTLIFIGLMGAALYLLVRDLPGTAAKISRIASAAEANHKEPRRSSACRAISSAASRSQADIAGSIPVIRSGN
jgi:hypothetical protein